MRLRKVSPGVLALALAVPAAWGEAPPLLPRASADALAREISGEQAKRELEFLTRLHRMRASREFEAASRHILGQLNGAGLEEVRLEDLPADGTIFYGTQRSRPAWNVGFAELWELGAAGADGSRDRAERIASWDAQPLTLAQDSWSGEARAELVDVGAGSSEADYAGKDVRGKLVLVSGQPEAAAALAVARLGAAGIVSWAQNQRTAWWGEDASLVRWGHLDTFAPEAARTFAFMVSPQRAKAWQARLARGEAVWLDARVKAGQEPGNYAIASAAVLGADPKLRGEEIVFSCHLDHPRPGANDNASGCASILEAARSLARLVADGAIPRPARTLRFVFPPEIEGTLALLEGRREWAARIKAAIHLDMVGGGAETKAVFHVTRGPKSLPSFVHDVAEELARFVNAETASYASTGAADYPLVAPEGGKEPLQADLAAFTMGSDHQVYAEGSWRIPSLYFNDWPDRYIHTTGDRAANVDPTKLKRAAFLAAASALVLADFDAADVPAMQVRLESQALRRAAATLEQRARLVDPAEAANLTRFALTFERAVFESMTRFAPLDAVARARGERFFTQLAVLLGGAPPALPPTTPGDKRIYARNPEVRGPMAAFGYEYLPDKLGAEAFAALRLPRFGHGGYDFEALNLVDGRRTVSEIRDALSAIHGPVPVELVAEYLAALHGVGVLRTP
ncbi:MAG: DUF4910 domain-containing protein [Vicinamibacteria bacterium]|nr:DUF4910 domain-containing protein [Vicinamibacteria bacterium]